ncbi:MAG: helix-hairpin-helix domain-containing protein [Cyclobacteriaceae bacterium]|nr:helix-hairpin-helix domain-containing protein [Cyclobacteriaceae bacterium]
MSVIALILLFSPNIVIRQNRSVDPADIKKLDSLVAILENDELPNTHHTLFLFNPNEISPDSLMLLGFPKKVAERLINYRSKGGRFYIKMDVKKIYGITDQLMGDIYTFINLLDSTSRDHLKKTEQKFDLNYANVNQLKKVSLIGDVLANRIVKYRDLLGGFVNMDQLDEVYGLSEMAKKHLKSITFISTKFKPHLIKINRDQADVILRHPYISFQLAEDIIRFREINSTIESEKVLAHFKSIDKSKFEKLIPYLDFQ